MGMRFGTSNIRGMYSSGSLLMVSKDLLEYKLHLVGAQEVRWESGGTQQAGEYTLSYENENENYELGTGFFVHNRIITTVKRVEFVSDRMPYIIPRGRWCHIIVLNVHAATEDKIHDVKGRFYYMKILLGNFNAKVGRKDFLN
jgi:hypothetical protein